MTQPPPPPPPPPPQQIPPPVPTSGYGPNRPGTNGMAVAAFIVSLFFAPLGIVFGHIALGQLRRDGGEGRGLAVAGLVIGYVFTAIMVAAIVFWVNVLNSFANALDSYDEGDDYSTYSASTYTTQTYTTPSYSAPTPTSTTRASTTLSAQGSHEAIRDATIGSCIIRERGAQLGDGTYDVTVRAATCRKNDDNFRVTSRVTDIDDCGSEWVRTTPPTVVLCLVPN